MDRISPLGFLPCLRRGSDRWWLPRSGLATETLGIVMIRGADSVDSVTRDRLIDVLLHDAPLAIFAALTLGDGNAFDGNAGLQKTRLQNAGLQNAGHTQVEIDPVRLADHLIVNAAARFASGDAFLGTPRITPTIQSRWRTLADHFQTIPFERWMDDANLWLETTGPTVSRTWQAQWPELSAPPNGSHSGQTVSTNDGMLQQLARTMQRHAADSRSFDRILKQTKLGAIKQLAYGLSHEINNPLANISTRAQSLQRTEADPERIESLGRIVDQVYRAHEMIADLMFFANPPTVVRKPCDLISILDQLAGDFQDECAAESIRLEFSMPTEPVIAVVDQAMIGEAVRALIRNAIDAIGCQGTIVVSLVRGNGRLMIHVADSGPGLSESARQHAFDPYFSGREAGRGLGLGLCRAYRIAKLHLGDITLAGGPIGCVATISLSDHAP